MSHTSNVEIFILHFERTYSNLQRAYCPGFKSYEESSKFRSLPVISLLLPASILDSAELLSVEVGEGQDPCKRSDPLYRHFRPSARQRGAHKFDGQQLGTIEAV